MGCSNDDSCSNPDYYLRRRKHCSIERRPRMLKDFLEDDSHSCSSTGFRSFPRKQFDSSVNVHHVRITCSTRNETRVVRSRSKALQAMINAVKKINFAAALKSPAILPRSFSRRLRRSESQAKNRVTTIKDIIRWRSFRDRAEEEPSPPLEFISSPPHHSHTATTTTATTSSCTSSSDGSSWCDSDFTSECEFGGGEVSKNNSPFVGEEERKKATRETRRSQCSALCCKEDEENQQLSPVSVIDFGFEEDDQTLVQKIRRFENPANLDPFNLDQWMSSMEEETTSSSSAVDGEDETEEKARQLLNHLKTTRSPPISRADERLVLDFFREELSAKRDQSRNVELYPGILDRAEGWLNGERSLWEEECKRERYVVDMNRGGMWSRNEEEQEEIVVSMEDEMIRVLVDEMVLDLTSSFS